MPSRRLVPTTFRDAAGAAAAEYLGILLVVALVVAGLNGAIGGSGAGIGSHLHDAICRISDPTRGSGCQSATAAAASTRSVFAGRADAPAATNLTKAGATTSALKAPAAATAPPTTAIGPNGETVVLTSCGPKQVGPTDTQVAADGTQTGWRTTTYGCVDATGAIRACSTRDSPPTSPSQWITLSIRSCSAPITDPVVATAVFDHGAEPDTVVADGCDAAVGMTAQAKAAVQKQYGPTPTGAALDAAVDAQMAVFAKHVKSLTGLDASDPKAETAYLKAMADINTVVASKGPKEFPVISKQLAAVYAPAKSDNRTLQPCVIAAVYYGLIAAPAAIGVGYAFYLDRHEKNFQKKAYYAIGMGLSVSTGFILFHLWGARQARVLQARTNVRIAALEMTVAEQAGRIHDLEEATAVHDAALVVEQQAVEDLAAAGQVLLGQAEVVNANLATAEGHVQELQQQMHSVQQHLAENGYQGPNLFPME